MINQTTHTLNENTYVFNLAHPVAQRCKESTLQEKIVLGTTFLSQWRSSKKKKKKTTYKCLCKYGQVFLFTEFVLLWHTG